MTSGQRDQNAPRPPCRTAMISARIATAISYGDMPPNSNPNCWLLLLNRFGQCLNWVAHVKAPLHLSEC